MEIGNLVMYIAYTFLFLIGLTVILTFFFPGLVNIETNIDVTNEEEYRKAIVLENLLSVHGDTSQYGYSYTYRKAMLPVEYFANLNPQGDELGYNVTGVGSNGHCYISDVEGLDGINFAFAIELLEDEDLDQEGNNIGQPNQDYKSVKVRENDAMSRCTGLKPHRQETAVVAPVLLVRDANSNPLLPARLYVYALNPEA